MTVAECITRWVRQKQSWADRFLYKNQALSDRFQYKKFVVVEEWRGDQHDSV